MNLITYILPWLVPTLAGFFSNAILSLRSQRDPRRKIIERLRYLSKEIDGIYIPFSAGGFNAWTPALFLLLATFFSVLFGAIRPFFPIIIMTLTTIVIVVQFSPREYKGKEFLETVNDLTGLNIRYYTRKHRAPILLTLFVNLYTGITLSFYLSKTLFIIFTFESVTRTLQEALIAGIIPSFFLLLLYWSSYVFRKNGKNVSLYYKNGVKFGPPVAIEPENSDGTLMILNEVVGINRSLDKLSDVEDLMFSVKMPSIWVMVWDEQGMISGRIISIGRYLIIKRPYSTVAIPWGNVKRLEIMDSTKVGLVEADIPAIKSLNTNAFNFYKL